ncbi:ABC transporter substrate-binding protein [Aeromicrobium alkaliterrae]|uniref:ABC transporter substrate-binding protein n=1 Tax=Aeromicrobium alkaliterrae TaxID=302168 RepID=A0ABP4WD89_9ACTN
MKLTIARRAVVLVAAGAVLAACSGGAATSSSGGEGDCIQSPTTGVTDDTIKLGNSAPLSGNLAVLSSYSYGAKAYFDMVNATGGLEGPDGKKRQVEFIVKDDGYDPSRAKTNVEEMVNNDEIYALVGNLGTATNLAIAPSLKEACVPNLWALSGTPALADPDTKGTINFAAVSTAEGRIFGEYLKEEKPDAKVAILVQNGDYGQPYLEGFEDSIEGTGIEIVDTQTYEPTDTDVRQQVTTLSATDADTFLVVALTTQAKQALNNAQSIGWKPEILIPSGTGMDVSQLQQLDQGAGENTIIGSYLKDPAASEGDPVMEEFLEYWNQVPGADKFPASNGVAGWATADLFARAFKSAESIDRADVVDAARNLDVEGDSVIRDGIKVRLEYPDDNFIIEGLQLQRFDPATKSLTDLQIIDTDPTA